MYLLVHYIRGDLATAENYFAAGLKFFDDPVVRQALNNVAFPATLTVVGDVLTNKRFSGG
jgi:hypothetical protein